jgi:hypothetical protein
VTGYCAITCQNYEGPGDACTFPEQCNPSTTVGCFTSEDGQLCRANKLSNGSICNAIEDSCASGICDATATGYRCIDGEAENEDCDDNPATTSTNLCGAGLYCDADDGQCKAQSGAGGTCADDDDVQCLNGACDEGGPWGADVCTDAPENAESVTCDGE